MNGNLTTISIHRPIAVPNNYRNAHFISNRLHDLHRLMDNVLDGRP